MVLSHFGSLRGSGDEEVVIAVAPGLEVRCSIQLSEGPFSVC
jgi:hypothetical protein